MHQLAIATTDGNSISVIAAGSGPKLVLLHGFPLDHRMWNHQLLHLSDRFNLIAIECRGFGQSTLGESQYSIGSLAGDVEFVLQRLAREEQIVLCGLSMGGYIAFECIKRFPQRIAGLVLANTKPDADTGAAKQLRAEAAGMALKTGTWEAASGMIDKLIGAASRKEAPQLSNRLEAMIRPVAPEAFAMAQHAMAGRSGYCEMLADIERPTLVIGGSEDVICPASDTEHWAARIPTARCKILPTGHLTPMEAPQAFNDEVAAFCQCIGHA